MKILILAPVVKIIYKNICRPRTLKFCSNHKLTKIEFQFDSHHFGLCATKFQKLFFEGTII